MRRIAAVLTVLTLVLVSLLAVKLHAQQAQLTGPSGGSGQVEGTEVRVASKLTARLTEVPVKKGATVKKGELLAKLDCTDPEHLLTEAKSRLEQAQASVRVAQGQVEAATGQKLAHSRAMTAAEQQAAALVAQRDASKRQADRLASVATDVSFSSRDQVQATTLGLEHQVSAAEANSAASAAQVKAAVGQTRSAEAQVDAAQAGVQLAQAEVERAQVLVGECELRAPRDASVEEVLFEPGELVGPGVVVVKLLDLSLVTATFYLPNAELAAVKAGQKAKVVADALPSESFEGQVRTVALEAEFTPRNIQTRTDRDRLVYPVEVVIANPQSRLRAGMPVQVTIEGQ